MVRMAVKAAAVPSTPSNATMMAPRRCVGAATVGETARGVTAAAGAAAGEGVKSEVGSAMSTTPTNETSAPSLSASVNGSPWMSDPARLESEGARKVRTVASARGRCWRESAAGS